ncbi:hypothetical protein GF325_14435, partial [Candidatus Bathyarchaeota archaeon]|nr:hypothetical protein [Candidatus Bathyarchaeota archaeon]
MNVQFELDALAFFTRSGHVTWQVGKERFRMDTPAFIPRIHEAFLDFTPYQETLSEIFHREWTGMAALPNLVGGGNRSMGKRALLFLANQGNHLIPMREYPFLIDNTNDLNESILVALTGLDITNNPPHGSSPACNAVQDLQDHQRRKIASALLGMNSSIAQDVSNLVNASTDGTVEGKGQKLDLPRFIISKQFELKHHPPAQLMQHSRSLHERIPLDVMRISDVSCLPRDATMLVHAGFDGLLENGLLEATSRRKYLFQGEILDISSRKVLPCTCKHCIALQDQDFRYLDTWEMQVLLYCHNLLQMAKAVAFLRELIRDEGFRHHVEVWSHGLPSHGIWLSFFNDHVKKLANKLQPLDLKKPVPLTGVASYFRPDIVRFRHKVSHWYHFPWRTRIVVLLPCSARKPYKDSKSHRKFIQAMNRGWERWSQVSSELMITSPLGIVPRQVEDCFPAAHYDLP